MANVSLFVYPCALSLQVESSYEGEEEEGGKEILARVNEKSLAPAYKAYMSRKFLQIATGQIRKKATTHKPPPKQKTTIPPPKPQTEENAQPNLRYAL